LQSKTEGNDAELARIQKLLDNAPEVRARFEAYCKEAARLVAHGRSLLRRLRVCGKLNLDDDRDFWTACYRAARHLGFSETEFNRLLPGDLFRVLEAKLKASEGLDSREKLSPLARRRLGISGGRRRGTRVDGQRLKALRQRIVIPGGQSMTHERLAEICGVSVDTIQRGEKGGNWSNDAFAKVAAALTESLGRTVKPQDLRNSS
jgi:DNA-binding XRE family transcriptional regulator